MLPTDESNIWLKFITLHVNNNKTQAWFTKQRKSNSVTCLQLNTLLSNLSIKNTHIDHPGKERWKKNMNIVGSNLVLVP